MGKFKAGTDAYYLAQSLETFKEAAFELLTAWQQSEMEFAEEYPFEESFEDVCQKISLWVEESSKEIEDNGK
jgi:hypothetical protein